MLAWIISLPLLGAVNGTAPLGWLDYAGVAVWIVGVVFESLGDLQLARFKAHSANAGKVMRWDLRKLHKDGSVMWVRESAVAVRDRNELVVLVVCEDFTERKLVEQQIAEGEWVATRITARGTHSGEWLGIAPTGRSVAFSGVNWDRVVDGRIVEHGGAANMLGPLLEIGAVRAVGE